MLIVNADDYGSDIAATNAIAQCFEAGAITSSTFMVHMPDSERAAALALESGWPIGLHLNFTQPFEVAGLPASVRDRQLEMCEYLSDLRLRRRVPEQRPHVRRMVRNAINEQLEAYETLFGRPPTHIDSHQHSHTALAVLAELPRHIALRRTASRRGDQIAARFLTTDVFMSFPEIERAAAAGKDLSVELMVHPSWPKELEAMLAEPWLRAMQSAELGDFRDLEPRRDRVSAVLSALPVEPAAAVIGELSV